MLKHRIATAIVLAGVLVAALFFVPPWAFVLFVAGVFTIAAWEWAQLAGFSSALSRCSYAAITALLGFVVVWQTQWVENVAWVQKILLAAGVWWAVALLWVQGYPASAIIWRHKLTRVVMGWLVLIPVWLACVYLHKMQNGPWLIVVLVLVVAAADVGAYFSGRLWGKHKLAPAVSPGKTWEGVIGGVLLVLVVILVLSLVMKLDSVSSMMIVFLPAAMISIVGDLLESMLKRHSGIKDSSKLLPGHGGVLDRIDGLVAAAPVFTLSLMLTGWSI